jgi:hypothetical protein
MARQEWRAVLVVALLGAALAGCAGGSGAASGSVVTPPDPLYRRTFTSPGGREWDFQIGGQGHVSER